MAPTLVRRQRLLGSQCSTSHLQETVTLCASVDEGSLGLGNLHNDGWLYTIFLYKRESEIGEAPVSWSGPSTDWHLGGKFGVTHRTVFLMVVLSRDWCLSHLCCGGSCQGSPGADGDALEKGAHPQDMSFLPGTPKARVGLFLPNPPQCCYKATHKRPSHLLEGS